jgi:hypothetical protein
MRESARAYEAASPRESHDRGMAAQMRRDIPGVEGRGAESAGTSLPLPERLHEEHPGMAQRKRRPATRPYTTPGLTPLTVSGGDMPAAQDKPADELTPLEELARRLEHARIPVIEEDEAPSAYESSIVSETLANILVAQGKYAEALKAFQTLARMKPERYDYLQGRIVEMKWRLQNPGESWPPAPPEEEIEEEEDDLLDEEMEYPEDAEEGDDADYLE